MKRIPLFLGLLLLIGTASARGDIFSCMDCSERSVKDPNGGHVEASCCMSVGGHCYDRDVIRDYDVGAGCRVSEADSEGFTHCDSDRSFDSGCGGGGGKQPGSGLVQGDGGCVTDQYGWCDISCMSCTSS